MKSIDRHIASAKTVAELAPISQKFLEKFPEGGIFRVIGEMGAGKTTFIASICHALGLDFMGSPTFALINEYELKQGGQLLHFDLYRLKSVHEALDIGFDEYLHKNGFIFIEWPDQIEDLLPAHANTVTVADKSGTREITF